MDDLIHFKNPRIGNTFCGIEPHKIYMKKGVQLAGLNRLPEVNCKECLKKALHYCIQQEKNIRDLSMDIDDVLFGLDKND